jgi:hypothetical protein
MNRISYVGIVAALSLSFLIGLSVTNNTKAFATGAQLVKIEPVGQVNLDKLTGVAIDPPTLHIQKNTIVIWMNGIPQRQVQVVFQEGKACQDVTANPVGFTMERSGMNKETSCYVTNYVPYADTSSLQFTQAGTFHYVVQTAGGKLRAKGIIKVE